MDAVRKAKWRRIYPALIGLAFAIAVVGVWLAKVRAPRARPTIETTSAVRFVRHDASGLAVRQGGVRDRARVSAIVAALGIDAHPSVTCPPDYSHADVSLILSGSEIYVRRSVYVYGLDADAGAVEILSTSSAGCHRGPPADATALRHELTLANAYP